MSPFLNVVPIAVDNAAAVLVIVLIAVEVSLLLVALVDLWRRPTAEVPLGTKVPWVALCLLVQIVGPLVYLVLARTQALGATPAEPERRGPRVGAAGGGTPGPARAPGPAVPAVGGAVGPAPVTAGIRAAGTAPPAPTVNGRAARAAVDRKFPRLHPIHTLNNACLSIWGLTLGRRDFSAVIGNTVAMGPDNDCTAATAGSLFGASFGRRAIGRRWHARFHDTVHSYITGCPKFAISDLLSRFARQAGIIARQG